MGVLVVPHLNYHHSQVSVEESEQQKADRLAKEAEEAKKKAEAEEAARLEEAAMNAMVLETSGAYREELGGAIRKIKLAELKRADRFMPAPALMTDLYKFANNKKLFFEWKTSGKPWLFMVALNHYQPTGAVASVLNDALTLLATIGEQVDMERQHYSTLR